MNHSELVTRIAGTAGLSNPAAGRALDAMVQIIFDTLATGGDIRITGLGVFEVVTRGPRQGRDPKNQEAIEIPAMKTMRFRPAKTAKARLKRADKGNA
jgi:DNA-binding protein HU-beta